MTTHEKTSVAPSLDSAQKTDNATPDTSVYGNDPEKQTPKSLATGPAPATPAIGPPPDGGAQAWLVVLGAFCGLFVSFGWINCKRYLKRQLRNQHSNSNQASESSKPTTKVTN